MTHHHIDELADPLVFPLLTAAEVGRDILGGVPAKTVSLYAREGRLPCVWVGKHQRFNRPSVERALTRECPIVCVGMSRKETHAKQPEQRERQDRRRLAR